MARNLDFFSILSGLANNTEVYQLTIGDLCFKYMALLTNKLAVMNIFV